MKHVLVVRYSSLGDILRFLPIATTIKRSFPDCKITWVARPQYAELLEMCPDIHTVVTGFPLSWRGPLWSSQRFLAVAQRLRRQKFSVSIDLHALRSSRLLVSLSRAERKISFHPSTQREAHLQSPDYYFEPLRQLGLLPLLDRPQLHPGTRAEKEAENILKPLAHNLNGSFIAVHPGASLPVKRWSLENFSGLIQKIRKELRVAVVVLCGPNEQELCAAFTAQSDPLVLATSTDSLKVLAAVISRAELFIGNDSGPLHLAATLGKRTLGIYGPSHQVHRPYGSQSQIVQKQMACSPCFRPARFHIRCPLGTHACLRDISVDDVFEIVCRSLKNAAAA